MTDEIQNALEIAEKKKLRDKASNDAKGGDKKNTERTFEPVKGDEAEKADKGRS